MVAIGSLGYAGLLIPLVSVAVALTLLPALISFLGQRSWWLPPPLARLMRCPQPPAPASEPASVKHSPR